jgi:drug/metabolite transporter (DMT)-like permease
MSPRYWVLSVFIGAVWGCSFLFNAVLIREIVPLWVSAGRVGIGAIGSWAYLAATRRPLPRGRAIYAGLLLLGLLNYAIPFALFPLVEQHLASGIVGVINAMTPMTTVIVSQLWPGGEKASWSKSVGVVVGLAGCTILAAPSLAGGASAQLWALGAALLATLRYAITLNYARRFAGLGPAAIAACSLTGATLVMVPLAFGFEGVPVMVRPESWGALLGIGLVSTSFAFLLMYWLLPRVGATNFSVSTFIVPLSAILLGVTVLGERFAPSHVLGMGVIFLGLIFIDGRLPRRLAAPKPA